MHYNIVNMVDSEWFNELYAHMRTAEEFSEQHPEYDIADVIENLFYPDRGVTVIMSEKEDDYNGTAFVVYEYKGKYFYLQEFFGSQDDWTYGSIENKSEDIEWFKKSIAENVVENIHEITVPLEGYISPDIRDAWARTLCKHGGNDLYKKCLDLANHRIALRKLAYDEQSAREQQAYQEKKEKEAQQLQQLRLQNDRNKLQDMEDVVYYLEHSSEQTDPFYTSKLPHKIRMLKFLMKELSHVSSAFENTKHHLTTRALALMKQDDISSAYTQCNCSYIH